MLQPHVSWMVIGGVSLPAVVTQLAPARYVATSADWREVRTAETACDALAALARAVEERVHKAMAASRATAAG